MPKAGKDWFAAVCLAVVYFFAGKLGLRLAFVHPSATPVWPPTGICIAAYLLLGWRVWPGMFLGAFLTNITTAGTVATSLGIATGNTLEGLLGGFLVQRFANGLAFCEKPHDVFKFTVLAAFLSPLVSATFGTGSLALGGFLPDHSAPTVWLTWWLGDAGGALTVAPFLILWATRPRPRLDRGRILEACMVFSCLLIVGEVIFGGWLPEPLRNAPLASLSIPFLVWAGFRFGPREATTASLALSALAIRGTLMGLGPFARSDPNQSLLILEIFIYVACLLALVFAAAVSERRRAEAALRRAYSELDVLVKQRTEELSRANAELEMFSAVASHDLQEPIHKITSFAELLENRPGPALDDTGRDMLRRIHRAAIRMSRLVEDLLSLSRIIRDPKPFEVVDLNEVLKEALSDLEMRIEESRAVVESAVLPKIRAHPTQMRQLLQNLIGNAIKFRDEKRGMRVLISVRVLDNGFMELSVSDNGIGFDVSLAERIFHPFVSLYVHGEYAGSGIGLAICRRIATRHGGTITAESTPGRGSVFTVTLPYSG